MSIYQEEHRIFQDSVKKFSEKHILPNVDAWEEKGMFPSSIFKDLGKEGLLGILMEEEWGGVGGDLVLASAWCEAFGSVPATGFVVAVNMHSLVILPAIQRYGSPELKEKWLPGGVKGDLVGAYAFTEPGAGSDLSRLETRAVPDGDDYIINGSKIFITNGARADFVIVLTRTDKDAGYNGFTSFLVDTKLPGFSVSRTLDKYGWYSSDTAELNFEDVRVPKSAILGTLGAGWKQSMANLEWERLMLSLTSLAGAKQCLSDTISYIKDRKLFGKTLADFDYTQAVIAEMWATLEASEASCHKGIKSLVAGENCSTEVSLTKIFVCEEAIKIADRCLQLHGGYGYTTEYSPERWLRDLRLNTIGGGTTEIMARIAAKDLFSEKSA